MKDRIIRTILTPILVVTLMWGGVCGKASACNGSNDDPSLVEPLTLEQEYVRLQSHRKLIEQAEADGYALSSEERAELLSTAGIERAMAELDAYYAENGISSTAQEAYVAIVDKYNRMTMITDVNSSESGLMTTSDGRISLNMTLILQENEYYCGPATVKSVVSKITGSSNTQSYYASLLGTTDAGTVMENIDDVLNRFSGTHTYTMDEIPNQYLWGLQIRSNMSAGYPVVLDIRITESQTAYLGYKTDGHFVAIGGIVDSTYPTEVQLVDPHRDYGKISWVAATTVYSFNSQHSKHSYIY